MTAEKQRDSRAIIDAAQTLEPFVKQWAVLLTTYKRDGTPVGTAVNIVVEGDLAYFRTWDTAWKLRRIRNNPRVQFAPSTARGKPTAPPIWARARVLEGKESAHAGWLLASKYPALHGLLVPLVHRLRGNRTMHVELTPAEAPSQTTSAPSGSPVETDEVDLHDLRERVQGVRPFSSEDLLRAGDSGAVYGAA